MLHFRVQEGDWHFWTNLSRKTVILVWPWFATTRVSQNLGKSSWMYILSAQNVAARTKPNQSHNRHMKFYIRKWYFLALFVRTLRLNTLMFAVRDLVKRAITFNSRPMASESRKQDFTVEFFLFHFSRLTSGKMTSKVGKLWEDIF